ncbi:hypothetical protein HD597_011308 [Nonomuraea thailandensis]|uniref:Uncharacterized protein n=1 Tax=Nonomuraea thailandensis TaxID=1188745 RepID=A0A9X2H1L1_9ACTN|nr:hypothetical protein [Nonomuraea thailandensis]MCP2364288.1 hypothetical protein [Nonomuraea thailandensis]
MATYCPCTTGTVALYVDQADDDLLVAVPVEAWDEAGAAYVAGLRGLVLADSRPGFVRLEQASARLPRPDAPVREPVKIGAPEPRGPHGPRDPLDPRGPRPATEKGRQ